MRYFNNFDAFMKLVLSMTGGFYNTLIIFFFTLLFSLPLGLAVALLRMSRRKIVSVPTSLYILVMRGTPLMLQIFAIYFAIPTLTGVNLDRMNATILAFSINYAAYFAEIFRGGIQSIPVFSRHPAADGKTRATACQQRGDYAGQGYVAGERDRRRRTVPRGEERGQPHRLRRAALCRGAFLSADERRGLARV